MKKYTLESPIGLVWFTVGLAFEASRSPGLGNRCSLAPQVPPSWGLSAPVGSWLGPTLLLARLHDFAVVRIRTRVVSHAEKRAARRSKNGRAGENGEKDGFVRGTRSFRTI